MGSASDILRAEDIDNLKRCDACGCPVEARAPMLFVQAGYGTAICLPCVRTALPQLEDLERDK